MAVHSVEITTENLLNIVSQMPDSEYENFIETASKLRQKYKVSAKEAKIILKINTIFPSDLRNRYNELYKKFQLKTLSEAERGELLELNDKLELLNAERLKQIGKLAKRRKQTPEQVIQDLRIKTSQK